MANGEPPEGWANWLRRLLQRHLARAKVAETKNRGQVKRLEDGGGSAAKYPQKPPEGWANWLRRLLQLLQRHFAPAKVAETKNRGEAKKGEIPQELTLDSSSRPLVPAHQSASELVIDANQTKNRARKRRRRPRNKKPTAANPSSSQQPDGLIEPAAVFVAARERTLDAPAPAPAPAVVAETDTEGWQQDAPKKRHGGGTERAAQVLALEPIVIEHDALRPTIAEQQRAPDATVDEPRPASALDAVPTPKPRVGAVCPDPSNSNGWLKPKKPRARWTPVPPPPRLPRPTPARRASPTARPTRPPAFVLQGDESEDEEDNDFGIKKMFEPQGQEVAQKEDHEREEEEELHLKYWIKNQELSGRGKGKDTTLCLICYLEQRNKVPEIANTENEAIRHLKDAHKIKREHVCKRTGCWVTGRNKRDIGMHQILCHNM